MKMVMLLVAALIIFGGAAGIGLVVKSATAPPPEEKDDETVDLEANPLEPINPEDVDSDLMPVAVREDSMSVEELLRFSLSLKERERGLKKHEEQFRQRQVQQKLVLADIVGEQQTITELKTQLDGELSKANDFMKELQKLRDAVVREREKTKTDYAEMESKQIEVEEQHQANDKKLSTWLQGMSAENAAAVLTEMANDGDMDVAVRLLANFEEREAAKILDSMKDRKLLTEFIAAFRNLKVSPKSAAGNGRARR